MASKPKIDRAQVHHVARLASLSLSDAQADKLAGELAAIVGYVEQLDELDTTGVPPTTCCPPGHTSFRPDEVKPGLSQKEALEQAPRATDEGFAVPGFVEG